MTLSSQWWSLGNSNGNVAQKSSFPLDEEENEDTIRVWINGQLIEEGWEYNPTNNSVVFDFDDAPQPGDSLDIGYSTWGCGEE